MTRKIIFKYWKFYLIFLTIILGLYFIKVYIERPVLLFSVNDISNKCYSNSLNVYSNGKYEIVGINYGNDEQNIIKTGTYNYDIDKVMNTLDDKTCDKNSYLNYQVTVNESESYCIGMNSNHELNKFIESLNEEDLFWCQ